MFFRLVFIISLIITLNSCAKNKEEIYSPTKAADPFQLYSEGMASFKKNDFFAHKKFSEAELNFVNPEFAAKSAVMASYALYGINFYTEAEENIKRYLKTYPVDEHVIYAKYLLAIIYYEQISDEKKTLNRS